MTKLSFPEVGERERQKLKDAGIDFQWLDRQSETIIIDDRHLRAMLDVLEADAEQCGESPYEGIVSMKLNERQVTLSPVRFSGGTAGNDAERANYVSVCGKRMEKVTKEAEKSVEKLRKKLIKATGKMIGVWRKEAFDPAQGDENERRARLTAEFAALKSAPHVQTVRVSGNTVIVMTDALVATDQKTGNMHKIGQFSILIDLDGKNGCVRWFNRDRRVNGFKKGMNAPNVFADGASCLSDTTQPMLELTARLELTVVVDLAIQFIENSGEGELGTYINLWPRDYR